MAAKEQSAQSDSEKGHESKGQKGGGNQKGGGQGQRGGGQGGKEQQKPKPVVMSGIIYVKASIRVRKLRHFVKLTLADPAELPDFGNKKEFNEFLNLNHANEDKYMILCRPGYGPYIKLEDGSEMAVPLSGYNVTLKKDPATYGVDHFVVTHMVKMDKIALNKLVQQQQKK